MKKRKKRRPPLKSERVMQNCNVEEKKEEALMEEMKERKGRNPRKSAEKVRENEERG